MTNTNDTNPPGSSGDSRRAERINRKAADFRAHGSSSWTQRKAHVAAWIPLLPQARGRFFKTWTAEGIQEAREAADQGTRTRTAEQSIERQLPAAAAAKEKEASGEKLGGYADNVKVATRISSAAATVATGNPVVTAGIAVGGAALETGLRVEASKRFDEAGSTLEADGAADISGPSQLTDTRQGVITAKATENRVKARKERTSAVKASLGGLLGGSGAAAPVAEIGGAAVSTVTRLETVFEANGQAAEAAIFAKSGDTPSVSETLGARTLEAVMDDGQGQALDHGTSLARRMLGWGTGKRDVKAASTETERSLMAHVKAATGMILRVERGRAARKVAREAREKKAAATTIQAVMRGKAGRNKAKTEREKKAAATTIQAAVRGKAGRNVAKTEREKKAATTIQAAMRGKAARNEAERLALRQTLYSRPPEAGPAKP